MIVFISIFTIIYGGTSFYIGKRLYQGISLVFPHINSAVYVGIFVLIALSLYIGITPVPVPIRRLFFWISAYWIGISVYLLMFFLAADIILFFATLANAVPAPLPHTIRFYAVLIAVALTAVAVAYGRYNANRIHHVHYEIQRTAAFKSGTKTESINIVLVSDLHLGAVNSEKILARMVQGINRLEPDIVCIAGDIFNDDIDLIRNPARAIELFRSINATHGVYASPGNHDSGSDFGEMLSFLQRSNITVLKDEHAVIDERLVLVGRLDPSPIGGFGGLRRKDTADVLALAQAGLPVVVMDHNPATIKEYGNKVDLILAGHTHGGQILPFNLITKALYAVHHGHFRKDDSSPHVVVTSGVSTWGMPLRIGSRNEIASIMLRA